MGRLVDQSIDRGVFDFDNGFGFRTLNLPGQPARFRDLQSGRGSVPLILQQALGERRLGGLTNEQEYPNEPDAPSSDARFGRLMSDYSQSSHAVPSLIPYRMTDQNVASDHETPLVGRGARPKAPGANIRGSHAA